MNEIEKSNVKLIRCSADLERWREGRENNELIKPFVHIITPDKIINSVLLFDRNDMIAFFE